jgi:hypothetical protein
LKDFRLLMLIWTVVGLYGIKIFLLSDFNSILGESLVTTAWRVLRLRMEETPSRCGGYLRIYWITSREQPTRGYPPAGGSGVGLTTRHLKK